MSKLKLTPEEFSKASNLKLSDLEDMKTISSSHTDDLILESKDCRIWYSRMTTDDGMAYDNQITVELLINSTWVITRQYEAVK